MTVIDEGLVRELAWYGHGDKILRENLYYDYYNNYGRKKSKGLFNKENAIEGIAKNYVPKVIQAYRKDFGLGRVNANEKKAIAKEFFNHLWGEYGLKEIKAGKFTPRARK